MGQRPQVLGRFRPPHGFRRGRKPQDPHPGGLLWRPRCSRRAREARRPHPGGLPARTFPKTRKTPHALKSMRGLIRQCPGLSVGQSPGDVPQQFPQLAVLPAQGFQLIAAAGGRGGHLLGEPAQPFPVAVQVVQRHDGR